jgi:hypothetical protein
VRLKVVTRVQQTGRIVFSRKRPELIFRDVQGTILHALRVSGFMIEVFEIILVLSAIYFVVSGLIRKVRGI